MPTQIVFTSDRSGVEQVYIMKANGDDVRLVSAGGQARYASMSSAGTKIAYAKLVNGVWRVFLNNHEGTNEQLREIEGERQDQHSPNYNRAGSRLILVVGLGNLQEIWRMASSGSDPERLTDNKFADTMPAFVGSDIVFVSNRTGNNDIFTMRGDGSSQTQLTTDGGDDIMPSAKPDGSLIIFSSNRTGTYQLYTMREDGTELTQLTSSVGNKFGGSFSLNGSKIFFYGDATGNMEIYSIDANGANETNLSNHAANDTKVSTLVAP